MTDVPGPAAVLRAIGRARKRDDFEAAVLFIAAESLDQGERVTREDWRRKWESMRDASPDLEIVTEQSVAEGEWIAHRYLLRGTHAGDFFGQPPTGAPFEARGLDMVRVRDGQLVEHWAFAGSMRPR
jgi:predicted ester cyclase